ncbi:MAG TPA: NAD-dependent epimerase [Chthonomonadales bacterium]|nr:NAD-dependent epimerase [Chthonomonadales bacterium]
MGKTLVTGAAGFIGFHLCMRLLDRGDPVVGVDNLNSYYDPSLKAARLSRLSARAGFTFYKQDIADQEAMQAIFSTEKPAKVVNLAAQAGVRYSMENPLAYVHSNVTGFVTIAEACRAAQVTHLVFASSSSVYGANTQMPLSVHHNVDHPVSLYAATKKADELIAHTYSHLYGLPVTGLRFFTVYGPWGRPDMALFIFTRAILRGEPIELFNCGNMRRDFTYVDDIVEGVVRVLHRPPEPNSRWSAEAPDPGTSYAPYRIYNIGAGQPVDLLRFIEVLEHTLGRKAERRLLPLQPGDVPETFADVQDLARDTGFTPTTSLEQGVAQFVAWYKSYYSV